MDESDKRVRKQWLILWICSLSISLLTSLLQLLFEPLFKELPMAVTVGAVAGSVGFTLLFGALSFYCIYRKPGTRLLTFYLVVTVLTLLATPFLYATDRLQIPSYLLSYKVPYLLFTQAMGVLWVIVSWRMRKTNLKLREATKQASLRGYSTIYLTRIKHDK